MNEVLLFGFMTFFHGLSVGALISTGEIRWILPIVVNGYLAYLAYKKIGL